MTGFLFGVCATLTVLAAYAIRRYQKLFDELKDAERRLRYHGSSTGVITVWKQQAPERQP